LLNNFANSVNNYKIKYKIFISFTIRRSKTTILISKVIVLISLVDIIVLILLLKKHNQLSKIVENTLISKKRDRLSKIKVIINSKKNNNIKILS
jgi:hypothetical protein